ncbi:hypothetical protein B0H17DRAFT_1327687 [Mycena rosella]|uniref:Antifreeze protein n=1 Tax=Mycena rosella TaxID=1033263 RepID=A0AAD7DXD4_MYCRO|nr:hypothetical protein B0H17DRAFT_1327687 [Mycena rosella]
MISNLFTISILAALGSVVAFGPLPVNLGTAGHYAILSKSGVSTVPPSAITGNVGVSPISATGLTGFSLTLDPTGQFSTSGQVVGELFAASYNAPTPTILALAINDTIKAYNDASGRLNPTFNNLASGAIGGLVLGPGLYKWTSGVSISSDVTIAGSILDTWIFQISGTLTIAGAKKMVLSGGALASNIVWVVAGSVTAGAGSHLEGVILGKTSITLQTGATANSRLLAQTFVALDHEIKLPGLLPRPSHLWLWLTACNPLPTVVQSAKFFTPDSLSLLIVVFYEDTDCTDAFEIVPAVLAGACVNVLPGMTSYKVFSL